VTPSPAIAFAVGGRPEPAGSKRAFPNRRTGQMIVCDANPNTKPWQATVAAAARDAIGNQPPMTGPVKVTMTFRRPRPKGHYGTGRNSEVVKRSAPSYPAGRPDVLKLARAVEDALTGIVWRDDAQIVTEHLRKAYGPRYELAVTVEAAT
jgi:Holliday junction resolvase RusA-like endonuclease